jgi:CrcB protein
MFLILAIAIGGFIGSVLRYGVVNWLSLEGTSFPWGTFSVNVAGCLLLGWFLTLSVTNKKISNTIRAGIGTGLIGSFTTFSAFSAETMLLIQAGKTVTAFIYVILSTFAGVTFAAIGSRIVRIYIIRRKKARGGNV